jgi:hypothetical protein
MNITRKLFGITLLLALIPDRHGRANSPAQNNVIIGRRPISPARPSKWASAARPASP